MAISEKYDAAMSLRDKVLYVLSIQEKGSVSEVATEIQELDGIATEDAVSDITKEIDEELNKLCEEGVVSKLKEHRQKIRYVLNNERKPGNS